MFSTNDFPDQPASRRGRRLKITGATLTVGALAAGGVVVASGAGASGTVWDRVAKCESTNNWSINTGNGYYGGLQFSFQTWKGFGGQKYAYTADRATKGQQIEIAQEVLKVQGPGAWPVCSVRAGLTVANGLAVDPHTGQERASRDSGRTTVSGALAVDGVRGPKTNAAIQKWVGQPQDGRLSARDRSALQGKLGVNRDSVIGPITTSALQRKVGASVDGIWGPQTTTRLQSFLNRHVL
ncbi:transglycosylase family protein [Janibacter cremeus]|uniref:Peptidoglycan hydrolase-like protein with peptidoglycan-binding domain n=1 Tax=Janibacter cremeus TaxID=1285192 RepID=A0A852VTA4_9MICO|nr:transglycosylase family protein [Janibacter cremeus]NYF97893.1 peptidoglycan hydrolase-like protein with peptidoglycan-binding domain [Janibacter cremeus]